jgi:beta-fructofuranosidase
LHLSLTISTLNTPQEQTQNVAFSYDGGYTFTEYTGNPVLSRNSTQFRDPKVFWYDDHWVMVVAFSVDFTIGIYTSPDLLDWSFASNFSHAGLLGLQYECPGLERLPIETFEGEKGQGYAWMLYISINPGAPLGGSIGEYFVGDFNGTHFEAYDAAARIADWGKDNYATQFWYAPDEDPTSIAWASNWQYTNRVPTADEGFRSIMSLPRHNYLTNATRIGWVLGSRPVYLGPVLESQLASSDNLINDTLSVDYTNVTSNAIYFQINLTYPSPLPTLAATASLNFTFSSSKSGENVTGGYLLAGENAGAIWLDRGNTDGFRDAFFTDKFSLTQATPLFARQIEGVIDRTVLELFLDGGHFSSTSLFYPKEMLDRMEVVTAGLVDGVDVSVAVWGLKSGWQ